MKLEITAHLYFHDQASERFDRVDRFLSALLKQGNTMTQLVDDLVTEVANVKAAVATFAPAVDALEAKITAILATSGITAADAAAITQAIADLKGVATTAATAVADAGDGVDEAATPAP